MIYWDSSCVLKLFVREPDSEHWVDQACSQTSPLIISQLTRAEISYALQGKEMRKEIKTGAATKLREQFETEIKRGIFEVKSLSASVIDRSIQLARYLNTYPLRTLDGIHLATAIESGCTRLASTDKRLLEISDRLGVTAL